MRDKKATGRSRFGATGFGVPLLGMLAACAVTTERSASDEEAVAAPEFAPPPDWLAHSEPGATVASQDPLNVVLSADSDATIADAWLPLLAPVGWRSVGVGTSVAAFLRGACISGQTARVEPGGAYVEEPISMRSEGCSNVGVSGNPGGIKHNHLRAWPQPTTGAWFLSVSEEHVCPVRTFPFVYHCIDADGFDQGREDLKQQTLDLAAARGWQVMAPGDACPAAVTAPGCVSFHYVTRPAGSGSGGVPYDDQVLVLTLRHRSG